MSVFKDHKVSLNQLLEFVPKALLSHLSANTKIDHYTKGSDRKIYILIYPKIY